MISAYFPSSYNRFMVINVCSETNLYDQIFKEFVEISNMVNKRRINVSVGITILSAVIPDILGVGEQGLACVLFLKNHGMFDFGIFIGNLIKYICLIFQRLPNFVLQKKSSKQLSIPAIFFYTSKLCRNVMQFRCGPNIPNF